MSKQIEGFYQDKKGNTKTKPLSCARCGLYQQTSTYKMEPYGNFRKRILCLGESPEQVEDREGKPWQGRVGKHLERTLKRFGIDLFEDCISLNSVNCRPPNNKKPTAQQISCCRSVMVEDTIKKYNPDLILLFGKSALESFMAHRTKDLRGIARWRGWTIPDQDFRAWVCPLFHPSYIVRSEEEVSRLWNRDIRDALGKLDNKFPDFKQPEIEIIDDLSRLKEIKSDLTAFDYETTGKKPQKKGHRIVAVGIADTPDHGFVFMMPEKEKDRKPFLDYLGEPGIGKVAANCIHGRAFILMADGSKQRLSYIVNNKVSGPVLSYNEKTGEIESKQITNWSRVYDETVKWKKIITQHSIRGSQTHHLTPEHKVYIYGKGMKRADDVKEGDSLITYKKGLSETQRKLILGSSLGDGNLHKCTHKTKSKSYLDKNPKFSVSHCKAQKKYFEFKKELLSNVIGSTNTHSNNKGFGSRTKKEKILHSLYTIQMSELTSIYNSLYNKKGKREINENYLKELDGFSIACWYMDDGSLDKKSKRTNNYPDIIRLHTAGFTEKSINYIIDYFYEVYDVLFKKNKYKGIEGHFDLALSKRNGGEKFCNLIAPYIIPSMEYKLPNYYKGKIGNKINDLFYNNKKVSYTTTEVIKIIDSDPYTSRNVRFDIEVKDNHNFFTTSYLVHNCSFEEKWSNVILGQPVKGWVYDTMLGAHILDNRTGVTGLKFQVYTNFGIIDYASEVEDYIYTGGSGNEFNKIDELISTEEGKKKLLKFVGWDSIMELRLALKQTPQMDYDYLPNI